MTAGGTPYPGVQLAFSGPTLKSQSSHFHNCFVPGILVRDEAASAAGKHNKSGGVQ
jgi:hypothetical protein